MNKTSFKSSQSLLAAILNGTAVLSAAVYCAASHAEKFAATSGKNMAGHSRPLLNAVV